MRQERTLCLFVLLLAKVEGKGKENIELFNFHVKMKFASNCLFPCNNLAFCFHFCSSFLEAL